MTTFLFVHGTGIREAAHGKALALIRRRVHDLDASWRVETAYWGTEFGARLSQDGRSIPTYDQTGGLSATTDADKEIALWAVLLTDPYYELRILRLRHLDSQPIGVPPSTRLLKQIADFAPSADTRAFFEDLGLDEMLDRALAALKGSSEFPDAAATAPTDPMEHRQAIARAIVAGTLARADDEGFPAVSGWTRQKLVDNLTRDLHGAGLGPSQWLKSAALNLASKIGTKELVSNRGRMSDAASPMAGDILRFLASPAEVEGYLAEQIEAIADEDVYVLGHSLGGIMSVDLLVRSALPKVKGLITVGSQAPFMYEIGALPALPPGSSLPDDMPPWLNIFDLRDVLSYTASSVFPERGTGEPANGVHDVRVDNGQPFPESHSAYWNNDAVWQAVAEFTSSRGDP